MYCQTQGCCLWMGGKAADLIFSSELPDFIKKELSEAKKYAEGRTLQIEVKTADDLDIILKMITIKRIN